MRCHKLRHKKEFLQLFQLVGLGRQQLPQQQRAPVAQAARCQGPVQDVLSNCRSIQSSSYQGKRTGRKKKREKTIPTFVTSWGWGQSPPQVITCPQLTVHQTTASGGTGAAQQLWLTSGATAFSLKPKAARTLSFGFPAGYLPRPGVLLPRPLSRD